MRFIRMSNSLAKMKFIFPAVVSFLLFTNCNQQENKIIKLAGRAQGTTWQITWLSNNNSDFKDDIDSIFKQIDSSLSTYLPVSIISRINKNDTAVIVDDHFINVFNQIS